MSSAEHGIFLLPQIISSRLCKCIGCSILIRLIVSYLRNYWVVENYRLGRCSVEIVILRPQNMLHRCNVLIVIFYGLQVIGCAGVTYWLNCYLVGNCKLCRCNVLNVILRLANYSLCRCNVLIELLLLENYKLCRCNVLIETLLLSKHRLCRCNVLILILMLVESWLKCYCLQVIGCVGVGLWLGCYCLLIRDCAVCCAVIGILLLESFRLCRCNALTSVTYYYSSLTFEVEEVWCTDNTRTSGWISVE